MHPAIQGPLARQEYGFNCNVRRERHAIGLNHGGPRTIRQLYAGHHPYPSLLQHCRSEYWLSEHDSGDAIFKAEYGVQKK